MLFPKYAGPFLKVLRGEVVFNTEDSNFFPFPDLRVV